jgi:hypothetical protein
MWDHGKSIFFAEPGRTGRDGSLIALEKDYQKCYQAQNPVLVVVEISGRRKKDFGFGVRCGFERSACDNLYRLTLVEGMDGLQLEEAVFVYQRSLVSAHDRTDRWLYDSSYCLLYCLPFLNSIISKDTKTREIHSKLTLQGSISEVGLVKEGPKI